MSNSQPAPPPYADDEISLIDLWQILAKRSLLIFLCFAVCIAGGAAFAFLQAPVFEASVKLRIGQVANDQPGNAGLLENGDELSSRLMARFGEDVAHGIKRDRPFLTKSAVQKSVATTIELVAEGDKPEDAARFLQRVVDDVQKTHGATYERNLKFVEERLEHLNHQRSALQQQYEDATRLIDQLKQRDAVQASLIMLERGRISASISELDAEKPALTQKLSAPQTRPTELLGEITAPAKAAKPKKVLILALSAVLGLLGGVMLAFVAEFVAKARSAPALAQ